MHFFKAFEQATRTGAKMKQDLPGTEALAPEQFINLTAEQACADNWVVIDEPKAQVSKRDIAKAWDDAIRTGNFRSVKTADSSPFFREFISALLSSTR